MSGTDGLPLADYFDRPAVRGTAIGGPTRSGHRRGGIDVEGVVAVDGGAARLGPLARPGWERAGLAYGPWPEGAGLALAVHLVNGHNAAQDHPSRSRPRLVARWLTGSGTDPLWQRVAGLAHHTERESRRHRFRRYLLLDRTHPPGQLDRDNLAIGWFDGEVPLRPDRQPGAIVVAGAPEDSGVLAVVGPAGPVVAQERIGELPMQVVIVARYVGVVTYVAIGVDDGRPPDLRPVGLVARSGPDPRWGGVHQRVMGEIGFSPDTRVYEVGVARIDAWSGWWTTALAADRLTGEGAPASGPAETGQSWRARGGTLVRTARGLASGDGAKGLVVLDPGAPIGLLHAVVGPGLRPAAGTDVGAGAVLHWRWRDPTTSWRILLGHGVTAIEQVGAGVVTARWQAATAPTGPARPVGPDRRGATDGRGPDVDDDVVADVDIDVVVVDDGRQVRVLLDGHPVLSVPIPLHGEVGGASPEAEATAVAVGPLGPGWTVRDLEAHPRALAVPADLRATPRRLWRGGRDAWIEDFAYPQGDLDGRCGPAGTWQRTLGRDRFEVARRGDLGVRADRETPAEGRTLYTVAWDDPDFVDLAVTVRPPGTRRGEGHRGRGGLVFWQDERTYVVVNTWLDDDFAGSSISVFPHLGGFEDIFDAVWVNVGDRIRWGSPYGLRVVCDGEALLIYAGEDQVLYRSFADVAPTHPRLAVHRVGLAVNWEWGTDTGTAFGRLHARRR